MKKNLLIVLLLILFGVDSMRVFASHSTHHVKVVATTTPTAAGQVYVGTVSTTSPVYSSNESVVTTDCGGSSENDNKNFYFYAVTTNSNFLWDGWYEGNTLKNEALSYNELLTVSGSEGSPNSHTRTAKWVQPKVTDVDNLTLQEITDPTQVESGIINFSVSEDKAASNYRLTIASDGIVDNAFSAEVGEYQTGTYPVKVSYQPRNIHGTHTAQVTLTSLYGGSTKTATVSVTENYDPSFSLADYDFQEVSIAQPQTATIVPNGKNVAAGAAIWTAYIDGTDASAFAIIGAGTDGVAHPTAGECQVVFSPTAVNVNYEAKLHLYCMYMDASQKEIKSAEHSIRLSGSGAQPQEATLSITPSGMNTGTYDPTTSQYTFLDQYGTVSQSAGFTIGFANVRDLQYTWSDNDAGVFSLELGTATGASQPLSIIAHCSSTPTSITTYEATLTVSASSTIAGESKTLTQSIHVAVTINPKKKNTLAWALPLYSNNQFRLAYTDSKDIPIFQDRNNMTTPITISSSTSNIVDTYFTLNTDDYTLTAIKEYNNSGFRLTAEQAESDEYEAAKLETQFRVRKHDWSLVYPLGAETANRLYKNTYYPIFISSNAEQAGEGHLLSVEYASSNVIDGTYKQQLIHNEDDSWGIQTGDTISPAITFIVKQNATENFYGTTGSRSSFYIIKDPIHVPVGPSCTAKTAEDGSVTKKGLWENNADYMYGSTYVVEKSDAEWIGYDWVGGKWTGTYTGKTDWAVNAQGNVTGATNAFAINSGGHVIFHFTGVPLYTTFGMFFQSAVSDGTVRVEESADGSTWTDVVNNSSVANYLQYIGTKSCWLKGTSQYLRYSYIGDGHVVITNQYIYENNHIRTDFVPKVMKNNNGCGDKLFSDGGFHCINKNGDIWKAFDFTIKAANWGPKGVLWESTNSDFYVVIDELFQTKAGADNYAERTAHVIYTGSNIFDTTTITLKMTDFYGWTYNSSSDNIKLRSYSFRVFAIENATMPQTITNDNKTQKYLTGTIGPIRNSKTNVESVDYCYSKGNIAPNSGLRAHDFVDCFGDAGNPLFDELYIFGMTTTSDDLAEKYTTYYVSAQGDTLTLTSLFPEISQPTTVVGSNAITPCYIYKKDGSSYILTTTIPNMNVGTKPIATFTESDASIYISGHCPKASTGHTREEIGVFHAKAGSEVKMEFYLSDCTIYSREKSSNGSTKIDTLVYSIMDLLDSPFISGSGAVFAFESTSTSSAFCPSIHLKGSNVLKSNQGIAINAASRARAGQQSSPIHIYATSGKTKTILAIDDKWPNEVNTNGRLLLKNSTTNAPSIDLGNSNSIVKFDGGRIKLRNGLPQSEKYLTTMAISYRQYTLVATMSGLGTDQSGGSVEFNDGSISSEALDMSSSTWKNFGSNYRDNVSLKCPKNTVVNGGTFDCTIWACDGPQDLGASPTDKEGTSVCDYEIKDVGVNESGFAVYDFPEDAFSAEDPTKTLASYYQSKGWYYGHSSIAPNEDGSKTIKLMLPCDYIGGQVIGSETVYNWKAAIPNIKGATSMYNMDMGGDIEVPVAENVSVSRLLWGQIDDYTRNAGNDDSYRTPTTPNLTVEATLDIEETDHRQITNLDEYTIKNSLYLMRPIISDYWITFCPPFDVKTVSVMETYSETELVRIAKDTENDGLETARQMQGKSNVDFCYFIAQPIFVSNKESGGVAQDLSSFIRSFVNYGYTQDVASGLYSGTQSTYSLRGLRILSNFQGSNYDANYFLYHSKGKEWQYDGKDKFTTDWEIVVPDEDGVLLHAGEIYAMQFPYCPGCDDPNERDYWDYWTGKFIIFEGDGPQTISGKNAHEAQFAPYDVENVGVLRGNPTFADMQVPNYDGVEGQLTNAFFHTSGTSKFIPSTNKSVGLLPPASVFMLANPNTRTLSSASKRIVASISVETGDVSYEDVTEDSSGVPTIGGNHTLFVTRTDEGIRVAVRTPQRVRVYVSDGALIFDGQVATSADVTLYSAGIYVIRGEHEVQKMMVQ